MWDGVRALLTSYWSPGEKDFLNGVKELGIVDLFLKDWDESMSVDGVKTLPDVEENYRVEKGKSGENIRG